MWNTYFISPWRELQAQRWRPTCPWLWGRNRHRVTAERNGSFFMNSEQSLYQIFGTGSDWLSIEHLWCSRSIEERVNCIDHFLKWKITLGLACQDEEFASSIRALFHIYERAQRKKGRILHPLPAWLPIDTYLLSIILVSSVSLSQFLLECMIILQCLSEHSIVLLDWWRRTDLHSAIDDMPQRVRIIK